MDNLPFWSLCAVAMVSFSAAIFLSAIASILPFACASLFRQRETWSASTASTDAEPYQETIPRASTSPIFPSGSRYQVFLSFRGKDTRKGFADHLYHALVSAGICVFRDDDNLRVGKEIDLELRRAISESKISIPILSETYASSKWCLQELTQAIERKKSLGHIVLPILYKVEPSHVRHQTGSFGEAFDSLREHCEPKDVEEWKQALKDVTSMKVWESEKIANGHEAELVKLVVEAVLSELDHDFQLDVPEGLVGIDRHVEEIMRFVDKKFNNTVMIGICGMGGIGKTTLAKQIYNDLSKKFVDRSFITDIRENGILHSQKKLISDILGSRHNVSTIDDGINIIRSRFRGKPVLILLDDIDDEKQLDNLTRKRTWFGSGSKVIVTTRDEGVLDRAKFGVDCKYELKMLDQQQSLLLFCRHAFRSDSPLNEFQLLSCQVVATTGGLPLALQFIGSLLFGIRDYTKWEDTIKKLRNAPEEKVQEKLKISYDALDYKAQQIFLHIACFLSGFDTTGPIHMWDDYNFAPRIRIHLLICRCLLRIEGSNFMMHDQLRDLGRAIIRQEYFNKPKNYSRLWDFKKELGVFKRHERSEKIRAVCMIPSKYGVYSREQFENHLSLRMFEAGHATFEEDFQNSLSELRWLWWTASDSMKGSEMIQAIRVAHPTGTNTGVCEKEQFEKLPNLRMLQVQAFNASFGGDFRNSCPESFNLPCELTASHLEKLVILEIEFTPSSEDWRGGSLIKRFKVLDTSHDQRLLNSLDLSCCTNLEIPFLQQNYDLEQIHHSIGEEKALVFLHLSNWHNFKELPNRGKKTSPPPTERLKILDITHDQRLPNSLDLSCCTNLEIPFLQQNYDLEQIHHYFGEDKALVSVHLSNWHNLEELPKGGKWTLPSLNLSYYKSCKKPQTKMKRQKLKELKELATSFTALGEILESIIFVKKSMKCPKEPPIEMSELQEQKELATNLTVMGEIFETIIFQKKFQIRSIPVSGHLGQLMFLQLTFQSEALPSLSALVNIKKIILEDCIWLESSAGWQILSSCPGLLFLEISTWKCVPFETIDRTKVQLASS